MRGRGCRSGGAGGLSPNLAHVKASRVFSTGKFRRRYAMQFVFNGQCQCIREGRRDRTETETVTVNRETRNRRRHYVRDGDRWGGGGRGFYL